MTNLLAVLSVVAASGGTAPGIGYVAAFVSVLVVLPVWLIRRRRRR